MEFRCYEVSRDAVLLLPTEEEEVLQDFAHRLLGCECGASREKCRVGILSPAVDAAPRGSEWVFVSSQLPEGQEPMCGLILWSQCDFELELSPGVIAQFMCPGGVLMVVEPGGHFDQPVLSIQDLGMDKGGFFCALFESRLPRTRIKAIERHFDKAVWGKGELHPVTSMPVEVPLHESFRVATVPCKVQLLTSQCLADLGRDVADLEIPSAKPFYQDWESLFPELKVLLDGLSDIIKEVQALRSWTPWPESHYSDGGREDWRVFPFMHCFPADKAENSQWVDAAASLCPRTTRLLKRLPSIRTALFSRLGGETKISSHRGWSSLANHVLRCHIPLIVPEEPRKCCGLWVEGVVEYHEVGKLLVFDDSKLHKAFNNSTQERLILIVDLLRPDYIPKGLARGDVTYELQAFIKQFNSS